MLLGYDPMAPALLTILRLSPATIPRFRDCWWNGEHIVLLTRTGGGNRAEYVIENQTLRELPTFVRDEDNEWDPTFAEFYYTMPKEMQWVVPKLTVQTKTMRERTMEVLNAIATPGDPKGKKAVEALRPLMEQITEFINGKR